MSQRKHRQWFAKPLNNRIELFAKTKTDKHEVDGSIYDRKLSWQSLLPAAKLSCSCVQRQAASAKKLIGSMAKVSMAED